VIRKPNVVKRRLYSQALGEKVQLNVTTTALRYAALCSRAAAIATAK
jgi:ribosomal protein L28